MIAVRHEPEELERRLEQSNSQLRRYAADMKQVVEAERRRGRELAAANERLARLDRLKSDFLTFISHELRTPLQYMSAIALVEPGASAEEQMEAMNMVRDGYERLNLLIQRGLDYLYWASREPGSVSSAVDWPLALRRALQQAGRPVGWTPPQAAHAVRGDRDALVAVFSELLTNVEKHGAPGGAVCVTASGNDTATTIEVSDSGGFPPEMAEEIFRPFTIIETRHHSQGSGLGLALSRAIVTACGGSLRAESRGPGTGAKFILELKHVSD